MKTKLLILCAALMAGCVSIAYCKKIEFQIYESTWTTIIVKEVDDKGKIIAEFHYGLQTMREEYKKDQRTAEERIAELEKWREAQQKIHPDGIIPREPTDSKYLDNMPINIPRMDIEEPK